MSIKFRKASAVIVDKFKKIAIADSKNSERKSAKIINKLALALLNKFVGIAIPFSKRNDYRILEVDKGYIKSKIRFKPNRNHIGTMYAGALFTVAEIPIGVISTLNFSAEFYPILKQLNMEYFKTAKSDVTVEFKIDDEQIELMEKEAKKNGKYEFQMRGDLKDKDGQIVARSNATYQIRMKRP